MNSRSEAVSGGLVGKVTAEGTHGMWQRVLESKTGSIVIVGIMLLAVIPAALLLPRITLQNDLATWLSKDDEHARALEQLESYFPPEERILVSWDTSSLSDPRSNEFKNRVTQSPYISKVRTAADVVQQMTRWKVDEAEAIRRLTGVLIGPRVRTSAESNADATTVEPRVSCVLTFSEEGKANPEAAMKAVQAAASDSGIGAEELHADGSLVTSLAVDHEVLNATWNSVDPLQRPPVFAISALAGIVLSFVLLRSVRIGLMVTAAAWSTAIVTTSLIPAVGHTMNIVTIVMPTLVIVITISAAIHVVNYWRHAAATGAANPIATAVRIGWWPCMLSNATTGIGLLSLSISRLGPIRDFGVFSTIGTLISFIVAIVGIPAMLRLSNVRPRAKRKPETIMFWVHLAELTCRHRIAILLTAIVLGLCSGFGLQWLKLEVKVGRYFPGDSRLVQDSRFLDENVGGTSSFDLLVHFGEDYSEKKFFLERMELIREIEEAVRQHTRISGAISLADFQPVNLRPDSREQRQIRMNYAVRSRRTEEETKTDELATSSEYMAIPKGSGLAWTHDTPRDETWRITAQTHMSDDLDYAAVMRDLAEILQEKTQNAPGLWFSVTGAVPVFYRAQTALLDSLVNSLALTFVLIAVTLMFHMRSIRAGLLSGILLVLPVAVVFGSMSWSGQVLDIGTMLTGSIAIGIAVDDTLHLITWFRLALRQGKTREEAVVEALRNSGMAMTQTALVIALSLLLLYPAELLLISRFGWVMAALLGVAWLSSVVVLPALLAGTLGRLIEGVESRSWTLKKSGEHSTSPVSRSHHPEVSPPCEGKTA